MLVIAAALWVTAAFGRTARLTPQSVSAATVPDVVAQVQAAFSDGMLDSASLSGPELTVQTTASGTSAEAWAGFEAAVLAHAVADWQVAHGQTPLTELRANGATGQSLSGLAADSIGGDSVSSPLPDSTCEDAAQNVSSSVSVMSARTLPFAGGTCVFKLDATSADAVAAGNQMSSAMAHALPSGATANDHPWLIEVDAPTGSPLLVVTWVPGLDGVGSGTAYVRPGLPGGSGLYP